MAMSVCYTVIDGEILHENRGGVERFYVPDALGNTAALVDTTGAVTDTYTYWPYGEIQNHNGSSTTPFTFVGTWGYFMDSSTQAYIRARSIRFYLTRWTTVDALWPALRPYNYAVSSPATFIDIDGLGPGVLQRCWAYVCENPGKCLLGGAVAIGIGCYFVNKCTPAKPNKHNGPEYLCATMCENLICGGLSWAAAQVCVTACVKSSCTYTLGGRPTTAQIEHICLQASDGQACFECCDKGCSKWSAGAQADCMNNCHYTCQWHFPDS